MKYIGRYNDDANYGDITNDYPVLTQAKHLNHIHMFVIETEDTNLIEQIKADSRIKYIGEDQQARLI
jgi:ligand-binding SRPBCC domain-containing protein